MKRVAGLVVLVVASAVAGRAAGEPRLRAPSITCPFAGPQHVLVTVRDEHGAPVEGALVEAQPQRTLIAYGKSPPWGAPIDWFGGGLMVRPEGPNAPPVVTGVATTDSNGHAALRSRCAVQRVVVRAARYAPATAWDPPAHVELTLTPGARIAGRVTADGAPVPDAIVGVRCKPGSVDVRTTTDASGAYAIDGAPDGRCTVMAAHPRRLVARASVPLGAGQEHRVDLALEAPRTVMLRVVDGEGRPLRRVSVQVAVRDGSCCWRGGAWSVTTDGRGRVRVDGLPQDEVLLSAEETCLVVPAEDVTATLVVRAEDPCHAYFVPLFPAMSPTP